MFQKTGQQQEQVWCCGVNVVTAAPITTDHMTELSSRVSAPTIMHNTVTRTCHRLGLSLVHTNQD